MAVNKSFYSIAELERKFEITELDILNLGLDGEFQFYVSALDGVHSISHPDGCNSPLDELNVVAPNTLQALYADKGKSVEQHHSVLLNFTDKDGKAYTKTVKLAPLEVTVSGLRVSSKDLKKFDTLQTENLNEQSTPKAKKTRSSPLWHNLLKKVIDEHVTTHEEMPNINQVIKALRLMSESDHDIVEEIIEDPGSIKVRFTGTKEPVKQKTIANKLSEISNK
jgi:hypothetical protein